ncbi:MAG: DsrE family protein [Bacteroidetes bacterium]|nr:DsrE family protein [Bacteroidota bacterium]MBS1609871.1 DsrE family protein [Bacteroidota bacterium]
MKKDDLLIAAIFFLFPLFASAQTTDYKVVFDLTSKDSLDHKSVIRWLTEVSKANPNAKMEVVMYGQGYTMVTKERTVVGNAVTSLMANKNISFKVCEVAMKNNNIDKSQLLPGIETVPDGIYEIIHKQREGWGYIKAVH